MLETANHRFARIDGGEWPRALEARPGTCCSRLSASVGIKR